MNRKFIYVLFAFVYLFMGCAQKPSIPPDPIPVHIDFDDSDNAHTERLTEKETPYTMCYKNEDGSYSLYIFTSPVSFYNDQGELDSIDNSIVAVRDKKKRKEGYTFENKSSDIKVYFPKDAAKKPVIMQDKDIACSLYAPADYADTAAIKSSYTDDTQTEHDAVSYEKAGESIDIRYIPTNAGVAADIVIKEKPLDNKISFKFIVDAKNIAFHSEEDQYTVFYDTRDNSNKAVLYTSFLSDSGGNDSFRNSICVSKGEEGYECTLILDSEFLSDEQTRYPLSITPSFEIYRSTMPDSTVYSEKPKSNVYLANYAVLGSSPVFGMGEHYWRFRINYIFKSYAQNIKSAVFSTVQMSKNNSGLVLELYRLGENWNSTDITWDTRLEPEGTEMTADVNGAGRYNFDITGFVKAAVSDDQWSTEAQGLLARGAGEDGYKVFAASDNALYRPYLRIDFYDMPWSFEKVHTINPG